MKIIKFLARENHFFKYFKKGARRLNNVILILEDSTTKTCVSIFSTKASEHKHRIDLIFDTPPTKLYLEKLTNSLKMTTWSFSKNSIYSTEKRSLKEHLNMYGIPIIFRKKIIHNDTSFYHLLLQDRLACLLNQSNSLSI